MFSRVIAKNIGDVFFSETQCSYTACSVLRHAILCTTALCFIEIWQRQQAGLQYDWDVANFELNEVISTIISTERAKK